MLPIPDFPLGVVGRGPLPASFEQRLQGRLGPPTAPPEERIDLVDRDPRQPGIERLAGAEPPDRLVGADERLLGEIVGVAGVAGQPVGHPVDGALVAAHDLRERGLIAPLGREHESGLVALRM